ncbi:MAG: hypothetical protein E7670_07670 [Ruminococcaceae bacterium]|nr:hypothetical protein [Oscillospiraceae bacterium]
MKNLKKFLFIFLALTMAFCLFACGGGGDDDKPCTTHVDENTDGKCDECGETMKEEGGKPSASDLVLIENGEAKFSIAYAQAPSTVLNAINGIKLSLSKLGIEITAAAEKADNVKECEVLIGNITTRADKYKTDGHDYGMEGYVIKIVDSKVIINAGSDEALIDAINEFAEDILGLDDDTEELTDVVMKSDQQVEEIQDDYRITSLSVGGNSMKGYTIAVNKNNEYHMAAAQLLQSNIYERVGYWLEIVDEDKADKSIVIKSVAKDAVDGGLKISASGNKLVIECGYDNKLEDVTEEFISDKIVAARGEVNFTGTVYTDDISVVYYKDFGAKGDGVADDFFALKAAHDFANISGQTVKATSGKTYRINNTCKQGSTTADYISIKTNVDWTGAKFIVDDSNIDYYDGTSKATTNIFVVESDYESFTISDSSKLAHLSGIGKGTTKVDLGLGYPAMLIIYNTNHRVYRRAGSYSESQQAGQYQQEVILIDKDGNVDESTPFLFDYDVVTDVDVIRTDIEHLTIKGGEFTTQGCRIDAYDNDKDKKAGYYARGLLVNRSYTTVDGLKHYTTGDFTTTEHKEQKLEGPHYNGFFYAQRANEVIFKNCVLTGRRYYKVSGTYDFGAKLVNKIRLEGCEQSNFWMEDEEGNIVNSMAISPISGTRYCWGIGGTNMCKNMEYIDSTLSRFDAHQGLMNGKIIGCTINFMALVGGGEMIIEDTTWISVGTGQTNNTMIYLRDDYGSPWNGTITIKNCTAEAAGNDFAVFFHKYTNWDFGYKCYFPNVIIDNLKIESQKNDIPDGAKVNFIYSSCAIIQNDIHLEDYNGENSNPVGPPEFITIINNEKGYKYYIPDKNSFFDETDFSACEEGSLVRK